MDWNHAEGDVQASGECLYNKVAEVLFELPGVDKP